MTPSLGDMLLEYVKMLGGGAGTVGGFLAAKIAGRFQSLEKAVETHRESIGHLTTAISELKQAFESYKRGSRPVIIAEGWQQKLNDLSNDIREIQRRCSSIEDDFDRKDSEDGKLWQEINRALGKIEGKLGD